VLAKSVENGALMQDDAPQPKAGWRHKILKGPALIVGTVLTAVVTASATWMVNHWLDHISVRDSDAVKLSVEADPARMSGVSSSGRSAIIPSTIQTHGSPGPGCEGFHAWVADNHGVDAGKTVLQIAAQGTTDKPVLLQNLRIKIIDTVPAMSGIAVTCPTAGNAKLHSIAVNLDATPPTVDYKTDSNTPFGFTLAKGETESFIVTATATKATYRWTIELDAVINGAQKTLQVGGQDGFTTTVEPTATWEWNYHDGWDSWDYQSQRHLGSVPASDPLPQIR